MGDYVQVILSTLVSDLIHEHLLSVLLSFTDYATLVIDYSVLYFLCCCRIRDPTSHLEPEDFVHSTV